MRVERENSLLGHREWPVTRKGDSVTWSSGKCNSHKKKVKMKSPGAIECCQAAAAKSLQSCPILCDPIDGSPPGSTIPGNSQARTLGWVFISFSNAWKWKVKVKSLSRVQLLATPWTAAHQAPPPMGFSRQQYWSGVPSPSPCHNWATNK